MDVKIDYLSFTVMVDVRGAADDELVKRAVSDALWDQHPSFASFVAGLDDWKDIGGRGHYGAGLFHGGTYTTIRYGGHANHILVEMAGTACQAARDALMLTHILEDVVDRVTRVDVAVDLDDGVAPADFVGAGYNERFKAHATIVSPEGVTEYVGSMKSDRYARVYQYAPPHPRAGVTRVEHVLRRDYAKAALRSLETLNVPLLAAACGNSFGWRSKSWKPSEMTDGKLRAKRADRHEPARLRWLIGVCVPALIKAQNEGLLSIHDVFETALSGMPA